MELLPTKLESLTSPTQNSSKLEPVQRLLEIVVKISGSLAAFGYLSLRSHLNFLGVPFQASLGVERYLTEAYLFLVGLCYNPDLLCAALLSFVGFSIARNRLSDNSQRIARDSRLDRLWRGLLPPMILLASSFALFVTELRILTSAGSSVIIGKLMKAPDGIHLAAEKARSSGEDYFLFAILFCVISVVLWRLRSRVKELHQRLLWASVVASVFLLTMQLPIIYGALIRPTSYYKVLIDDKGTPLCRALLLDNSEKVELWHAERGVGIIDILPAKDLTMRTVGDVNVIEAAAQSASTMEVSPTCTSDKP